MQGSTEQASHNNSPCPTQPALAKNDPPGTSALPRTVMLVWSNESLQGAGQHGDGTVMKNMLEPGWMAVPAQRGPGSQEEETGIN